MDCFNYLWFDWVFSEYWLAQGDRGQAHAHATSLCQRAAAASERTFRAIGHRLRAEIALAEQAWEEAQAQVSQALAIIKGAEVPLAAWRVYATAAALHERRGHSTEAEAFRCRGAEVIHALTDSLDETDPLRQSLAVHPLLGSVPFLQEVGATGA
jgi:hypothetical protein